MFKTQLKNVDTTYLRKSTLQEPQGSLQSGFTVEVEMGEKAWLRQKAKA